MSFEQSGKMYLAAQIVAVDKEYVRFHDALLVFGTPHMDLAVISISQPPSTNLLIIVRLV